MYMYVLCYTYTPYYSHTQLMSLVHVYTCIQVTYSHAQRNFRCMLDTFLAWVSDSVESILNFHEVHTCIVRYPVLDISLVLLCCFVGTFPSSVHTGVTAYSDQRGTLRSESPPPKPSRPVTRERGRKRRKEQHCFRVEG